MSKVDFQKVVELEPAGADRWIGHSPDNGWERVFGGQVIAQAMVAAQRTVFEPRAIHSLHSYFILGGDPKEPIQYDVERVRDGRSFTTRRVVASQRREEIFILSSSYQVAEEGLEHVTPAPPHRMPDATPEPRDFVARGGEQALAPYDEFVARMYPIEMKPLDMSRYLPLRPGESRPTEQMLWVKIAGDLPDDPHLHAAGLAYLSDMSLLDSALARHGQSVSSGRFQLASLDHALWFHRPVRIDEWLLYVQDSPSAQGGRALCRGMLFDLQDRLVASVAQEGLIRPRRKT